MTDLIEQAKRRQKEKAEAAAKEAQERLDAEAKAVVARKNALAGRRQCVAPAVDRALENIMQHGGYGEVDESNVGELTLYFHFSQNGARFIDTWPRYKLSVGFAADERATVHLTEEKTPSGSRHELLYNGFVAWNSLRFDDEFKGRLLDAMVKVNFEQ